MPTQHPPMMQFVVAVEAILQVSPEVLEHTLAELDVVLQAQATVHWDSSIIQALRDALACAQECGHMLISVGNFPVERVLGSQDKRRN